MTDRRTDSQTDRQTDNKFGTNNDASWMDEDEDEDKDEDSLLTTKKPFRMITELFLARFTFLNESGYGLPDRRTDTPS